MNHTAVDDVLKMVATHARAPPHILRLEKPKGGLVLLHRAAGTQPPYAVPGIGSSEHQHGTLIKPRYPRDITNTSTEYERGLQTTG